MNFYAYCLNNPVNCNDPSGNIPLPLVTGLIGGAAGGLGNAVGQIVANQGFNNFSFRDVGIASGVGFVAGVAAPFTATTVLGAALTGSAANVAQFGITQTVKGENITVSGALINAATGLAGGVIGGPVGRATGLRFAENSPFINSAFARQLNNNLDIKLNTGGGALARNFFGAIFSSLDPSPLFNTNQSAAGGFLLYPNKSNTNTVQEVYTK